MKKATYNDYQTFWETRDDLEGEGYIVDSHTDFDKNEFTISIERTSLVPKKLQDPEEFK